MGERFIRFIFFGNYFVGFLAIALSVETCVQLRIPFNSLLYYLLLFSGTVMYYTYAYTGALRSTSSGNLRSEWYRHHPTLVRTSQWFFLIVCISLSTAMLIMDFRYLLRLPLLDWLIVTIIFLLSVLYYGLLPKSVFKLNLRNTGWLKAFVIGLVWAGCVSLIPIVVSEAEGTAYVVDPVLLTWLFIKNWMFCTVNAIMFDIKDYEDDSNKQLKTFVVQFGLRRTVSFILIPLTIVATVSILAFTQYRHLGLLPVSIILLPFLLLLIVSYSMYRRHSIFYYLIVIDGLVLIKAICGILAMQFIHT